MSTAASDVAAPQWVGLLNEALIIVTTPYAIVATTALVVIAIYLDFNRRRRRR